MRPRPRSLEPLIQALGDERRLADATALRPGIGGRAAAVLILLKVDDLAADRPPEILFVERASTMRTHAGQIAFPGGGADPGDRDLSATALREASEEAGIAPGGVEVLGCLPPVHVAVSGFDVTAVVGWWHTPGRYGVADPREVASVLFVPVSHLVDPARRALVRHPSGYTGPAFEIDGELDGERHLVWGLTGHLLDGLLDLAGWQQPWSRARVLEIPTRYLRDRPERDPGGPDAH